jgi:hypothetical protein
MRTKLILGMTVGVIAAAQVGNAQGLLSDSGNELVGPAYQAIQNDFSVSATPAVAVDNSPVAPTVAVDATTDTTVVRRNSSDTTQDNWAPSANWMDSGIQSDLTAFTPSDDVSAPAVDTQVDFASSSTEGMAANGVSGAKVPNLGGPAPEPGTIQLLVIGGSALASGVMARRKKN